MNWKLIAVTALVTYVLSDRITALSGGKIPRV
jgi:hypothetical protein